MYFAHNLSFDFFLIFPSLLRLGVTTSLDFCDFNLSAVKLTYKGRTLELRCSYHFIPTGLGKLYPRLSTRPKLGFPYKELSN